jgi:hypothetical protein
MQPAFKPDQTSTQLQPGAVVRFVSTRCDGPCSLKPKLDMSVPLITIFKMVVKERIVSAGTHVPSTWAD